MDRAIFSCKEDEDVAGTRGLRVAELLDEVVGFVDELLEQVREAGVLGHALELVEFVELVVGGRSGLDPPSLSVSSSVLLTVS
ncbi:MAG: hypothetical protein GY722_05185 [bacterium]|nr:hypothetical protein [bacterium]